VVWLMTFTARWTDNRSADKVSFRCDCTNRGFRRISSVLRDFFVTHSASLRIFLQSYAQSLSVLPVLLALIDIAFCGLRGYVGSIKSELKTAVFTEYPTKIADRNGLDPWPD
jgi:hypothetical protein